MMSGDEEGTAPEEDAMADMDGFADQDTAISGGDVDQSAGNPEGEFGVGDTEEPMPPQQGVSQEDKDIFNMNKAFMKVR